MIKLSNMNLKLLFSAALVLVFTGISHAQIDLGKIARDAKRSVNKRIDRNIDKGIDNTLDNTEDVIKGKKKKKKGQKDDDYYYDTDGKPTIVKEVIPHSFGGSFMISRDIEEGNEENNMYLIAMDKYETAIRPLMVKKPHNLIIYNKEEETQTSINTEKYEGKALRDWVMMEDVKVSKLAEAERTDEIESIEGYVARKYIIEHRDYEGIIWFTKEIDADLRVINHLLEITDLQLDSSLGFPLRMELNFDDGHKEVFKVSDIKEEADKSIFDISEYGLVDMTDLESGK